MRNRFVGADHGDIIGHYPRSNGAQAYDLLHSLPTFSGRAFAAVWGSVAAFAFGRPAEQVGHPRAA